MESNISRETTGRRDFLKLASTVAAGVATASWAIPVAAQSAERKGENNMKSRKLGGLEV